MKFTQSKSKICQLLPDKTLIFKTIMQQEDRVIKLSLQLSSSILFFFSFKLLLCQLFLSSSWRCDCASNGSASLSGDRTSEWGGRRTKETASCQRGEDSFHWKRWKILECGWNENDSPLHFCENFCQCAAEQGTKSSPVCEPVSCYNQLPQAKGEYVNIWILLCWREFLNIHW